MFCVTLTFDASSWVKDTAHGLNEDNICARL